MTPRNIPVVGTAPPEPGSTRVRVVLSERKGVARPVRTIKEVQEGTAVGELLRRDLIRSQLKVTLRFALLTVFVLGSLPRSSCCCRGRPVPRAGPAVPWLLLGLLLYPFLVGVAWRLHPGRRPRRAELRRPRPGLSDSMSTSGIVALVAIALVGAGLGDHRLDRRPRRAEHVGLPRRLAHRRPSRQRERDLRGVPVGGVVPRRRRDDPAGRRGRPVVPYRASLPATWRSCSSSRRRCAVPGAYTVPDFAVARLNSDGLRRCARSSC